MLPISQHRRIAIKNKMQIQNPTLKHTFGGIDVKAEYKCVPKYLAGPCQLNNPKVFEKTAENRENHLSASSYTLFE